MNKFNPFYLWSLYDPIDFSVVNGLPSSQLHKIVTFSTLSIYTHKLGLILVVLKVCKKMSHS